MNGSFEIREYVENGRSPYAEWFGGLEKVTAARVSTYIRRLAAGNFGAAKALQEGVFELRMELGRAIAFTTGARAARSLFCWAAEENKGRAPILPPLCNVGGDLKKPEHKMITTRDHTETILARIKREPEFARALYVEAMNCFLGGETAIGLSILRDLVNAEISFK